MTDAPPRQSFVWVSRGLAAIALTDATLVLVGWYFDVDALRTMGMSTTPMMPLTAVCVVLLALSLLLSLRTTSVITHIGATALAFCAGAIAAQSMLQTILGISFGSDLWLFPDQVMAAHYLRNEFPGRMATVTALLLVLVAVALLLQRRREIWRQFAFMVAIEFAVITALVSVAGQLLGDFKFASFGMYYVPALHTPLVLALLAIGIGLHRPDLPWRVPWRELLRANPSLVKIAAAVLLAALLTGVVLQTRRADKVQLDLAIAVVIALTMATSVALLVVHARNERQSVLERARIAVDLAAAQAAMRQTQDAVGIVNWRWNRASRNWLVNDPGKVLALGLNDQIVSQDVWRQAMTPAELEKLEAELALSSTQGMHEFEFSIVPLSGERRYLLARAWRVPDSARGDVNGIFLDITDRKATQLALEKSEHRFQLATRALRGYIYEWDPANDQLVLSGAVEETTGFPLEFVGTDVAWWRERVHPDDRESLHRARQHAVQGQASSFIREYRMLRKDAKYIWVAEQSISSWDTTGKLRRIVGNVIDVSNRKRTEDAVQENLKKLRLALATADIGMWEWDISAHQLMFNDQCLKILGHSGPNFLKQPDDFLHLAFGGDDYQQIPRQRAQQQSADAVTSVDFQITGDDGVVQWFHDKCTVVFDERGGPLRVIGTLRDITARKRFENEREQLLTAERAARVALEDAARQKDDFLAMISHELRSPLNAIMGWVTLMRKPNATAATLADGLPVIERNARIQAQMLNDLFDAHRMVSGTFTCTFAAIDLNDVAKLAAQSLETTAAAKKVTLETNLHHAPLLVSGDADRLQQVFFNILANAIKFTPAGGLVQLRTAIGSDRAIAEVVDNGEGIASEFLPHLFEKFRQGDTGTARRHSGLGLGLAIAKQLVETHHGSIKAASEGLGTGARITIALPLLSSPRGSAFDNSGRWETDTIPQMECPLNGARILVVEDAADAREFVSRLLTDAGGNVDACESADEAMQLLSQARSKYDLLISDIAMVGTSGYDLIRRVRTELHMDGSALPALALTALGRDVDVTYALRCGFQAHLAKPVHGSRLLKSVCELLKLQ